MKQLIWFVASALLSVFVLHGCATTDPQALLDEINQKPVVASSLKGLTYEPMELGERSGLGFGGRKTPVFDFPEGKAYFKPVRLPASDKPYYLVVRAYLAHEPTVVRGPAIMPLKVITLDGNFERVREVGQDGFRWSEYTIKFPTFGGLIYLGTGPFAPKVLSETYRQTALLVQPESRERYAAIYVDPSLAFEKIRIPWGMELMGPYWSRIATHLPFKGNVGVTAGEVSLLEPEELLISPSEWRQIGEGSRSAKPGETVSTKWFKAKAPIDGKYKVTKMKVRTEFGNGDRVEFVSDDYRYRFFVHSEPKGPEDSWTAASARGSVASKELPDLFDDFSYKKSDMKIGEVVCQRLDFTGKSKQHFLSPTEGYDIHCVIWRLKEDGDGFEKAAVRIGGGALSPPGHELPVDRDRVAKFIDSIELLGSPCRPPTH